jgi:hypothetical protein
MFDLIIRGGDVVTPQGAVNLIAPLGVQFMMLFEARAPPIRPRACEFG